MNECIHRWNPESELPGLLCRMAGRSSEADPEGRTCGQRLMEKGSLEKSVMWGGSGGGWGTGRGRKKPSRGVISGEDSAPPRALTQETSGIKLAEFVPPQGKGLGFQTPAPVVARRGLLGERKLGLSGHPPVLRRKLRRAEKLGGAQRRHRDPGGPERAPTIVATCSRSPGGKPVTQ